MVDIPEAMGEIVRSNEEFSQITETVQDAGNVAESLISQATANLLDVLSSAFSTIGNAAIEVTPQVIELALRGVWVHGIQGVIGMCIVSIFLVFFAVGLKGSLTKLKTAYKDHPYTHTMSKPVFVATIICWVWAIPSVITTVGFTSGIFKLPSYIIAMVDPAAWLAREALFRLL